MPECPICGGNGCQVDKLLVSCINADRTQKVEGYRAVEGAKGWVWEPSNLPLVVVPERNGHRKGVKVDNDEFDPHKQDPIPDSPAKFHDRFESSLEEGLIFIECSFDKKGNSQ